MQKQMWKRLKIWLLRFVSEIFFFILLKRNNYVFDDGWLWIKLVEWGTFNICLAKGAFNFKMSCLKGKSLKKLGFLREALTIHETNHKTKIPIGFRYCWSWKAWWSWSYEWQKKRLGHWSSDPKDVPPWFEFCLSFSDQVQRVWNAIDQVNLVVGWIFIFD